MPLYQLIYLLLLLTCCWVGVVKFSLFSKPIKLIVLLTLFIIVAEIGALALQKYSKTNYPLYHSVPAISSVVYGFIFYHFFKTSTKLKYWPILISGIVAMTSILVSVWIQSIYTFPSIGLSLLGLYVTFCSLVLFTKMLLNPESKSLIKEPKFWFGIGSLIFYSSTFFFFGLFKSIRDTGSDVPDWGYILIRIANYIMYSCYLITLWLAGRQGRKATSA
ncbi:hypothetical protein Oweho_0586 [Owenweeksia hongkongensis DSM 17368]|uniref:YhhN-like protein n=1 Tax=Owenweeksia hongkongensis (strain DSM 17368 / CIP 108786 / JCM 12287 / NRRL B-23963 / UST20020801) TaxID=926562 RepID=G8R0E2_OWEHD|nr:hypothetical protein [Owenweeksia hongkongensis]AEV31602.1 hypothetical protein Oweho_0586 [Owenweeksia hongkongensis DSM 17368]